MVVAKSGSSGRRRSRLVLRWLGSSCRRRTPPEEIVHTVVTQTPEFSSGLHAFTFGLPDSGHLASPTTAVTDASSLLTSPPAIVRGTHVFRIGLSTPPTPPRSSAGSSPASTSILALSVLERALSKRLNRTRRQNPAVLNPQVDWLCEVKSRIVAESPRWLSRDESVGSPISLATPDRGERQRWSPTPGNRRGDHRKCREARLGEQLRPRPC